MHNSRVCGKLSVNMCGRIVCAPFSISICEPREHPFLDCVRFPISIYSGNPKFPIRFQCSTKHIIGLDVAIALLIS